jgi:predicted dienelactone hydrolase
MKRPYRRSHPSRSLRLCGVFKENLMASRIDRALIIICSMASILAVQTMHAPPCRGEEYAKRPGPFKVETIEYDWIDAKRNRQVPARIYYPKNAKKPSPVIIFSHGLGGSREGYEYLGNQWAGYGYVSVHVQHRGSDAVVWQKQGLPVLRLGRAMMDPKNSINRPLDISFAIDQMEKLNAEKSPFEGRLDLEHIGVAGHSFGAFTALAVAGEVFVGLGGKELSFLDHRVKAVIAMSAPVPKNSDRIERAFNQIKVPCLHMTGTRDNSPMGEATAEDRRIPYDHINGADQYLVVFQDGDHMVFAGPERTGTSEDRYVIIQDFIRMSSTAFWDAYLKGSTEARQWLAGGGFESALADNGTFEEKLAKGF